MVTDLNDFNGLTQTTNLGSGVRISSGAPLPNKSGHCCRRRARHHQTLKNIEPAVNANLVVADVADA